MNLVIELLGEIARELKHDDILEAAEQRPRLLLDALLGTHTLLLLDKLESLLKTERDIVFAWVSTSLGGTCRDYTESKTALGSRFLELRFLIPECACIRTKPDYR